jgi:hypothetical protein
VSNKSRFVTQLARKSSRSQDDAFGRVIDIEARLGCSPTALQWLKRASYKPLYTRRFIGEAKQRLPNQCRRGRLGQLSLAAHDRYRLRSARRGVAVFRAKATKQILPQRRLSAGSTVSVGTRKRERGLFRGYDGPTRPSAPNQRAMYVMADWKIGHSYGRSEAQSVRDVRANRNHQTPNQSSLRNHVNELPISRRSTTPLSARSFNRRYALSRTHPTHSATSVVPATPPRSRSASMKSSSEYESVYRPLSPFRSGATFCVLIPLRYTPYGKCVTSHNVRGSFISVRFMTYGTDHRSLGTRWRVRVLEPPGPGSAPNKPMNEYGNSRLESSGFCALSPVTTSGRVSANESCQTGPEQAARGHRRQKKVVGNGD